ncbi:hypothetical protein Fmac_005879 [Flemingia macrophylla]|uniref:Uncharacterized protein n=1 Tax=Flemingia macrophylla TaxID=520843 RepID=A0ABD1N968_9FABA
MTTNAWLATWTVSKHWFLMQTTFEATTLATCLPFRPNPLALSLTDCRRLTFGTKRMPSTKVHTSNASPSRGKISALNV